MNTPFGRVTNAEIFHRDVVVTFEDGRSAIYSAALLMEMLSKAELVPLPVPD